MKRFGGALFCLLIAVILGFVSVLTGSGVVNTLYNVWDTSGWVQVEARLVAADLIATPDRKTISYRATASYLYDYQGHTYQSREIASKAYSGGEDSGGFHQEMGNRLIAAKAAGKPIMVWMNPANPTEAVIDKSVRWGLFLALVPFALVFGALGLGALYGAYYLVRFPGG